MVLIRRDQLPRMIACLAVVGERDGSAGDDAFKAHQALALTAFAWRVVRHSATRFLAELERELTRRIAGQSQAW